MATNLRINADRLWDSLMEMAKIGATPKGGCNRQALTDEDSLGRRQLAAWGAELGLALTVDRLGNPQLETREVTAGDTLDLGEVRVTVAKGNHPGGSLAYRIDYAGKSMVYATDTEHYSCVDPALRALSMGADVLVYDSQYTPAEYPSKVGWGHSTYEDGVKLAREAGVGQYVMFHHDPKRSDAQVEELERRANALLPGTVAAREGMVIELGRTAVAA